MKCQPSLRPLHVAASPHFSQVLVVVHDWIAGVINNRVRYTRRRCVCVYARVRTLIDVRTNKGIFQVPKVRPGGKQRVHLERSYTAGKINISTDNSPVPGRCAEVRGIWETFCWEYKNTIRTRLSILSPPPLPPILSFFSSVFLVPQFLPSPPDTALLYEESL